MNTYNQNSYGMRDGVLKFQNPDSMRNDDSEAYMMRMLHEVLERRLIN